MDDSKFMNRDDCSVLVFPQYGIESIAGPVRCSVDVSVRDYIGITRRR